MRQHHIPWADVLDLQIIQALGRHLNERFNLAVALLDQQGALHHVTRGPLSPASGDELRQLLEQPLQGLAAGVRTVGEAQRELAAPIAIDDRVQGFVLSSAYWPRSGNGTHGHGTAPVLGRVDERSVTQLLELMAQEVTRFQQETARAERRNSSPDVGPTKYSYDGIIGRSRAMMELYRLLDKVIDSDSTVLVQGENGTGKELIARAIHDYSSRSDHRFVVQNCSAFNDNLLDSELFGHKKGAFTGAISDKQGLFEVADGSTFFLDEIGDMSPSLQVKLLRVLQEGTFIPVGDTQPKTVDVRIIAATNRDLKQMVAQGAFREDLYYRINVINIRVPPLRERKEDIVPLVEHFLRQQARGSAADRKKLGRETLRRLQAYDWPGNIRELENEIERLVVLAGEERLIGDDLLSSRIRRPPRLDRPAGETDAPHGLPEAVQALERSMIYEVLKRNHWNKTRAAQELHISRRNLIRKVNKYQLDQRRAG